MKKATLACSQKSTKWIGGEKLRRSTRGGGTVNEQLLQKAWAPANSAVVLGQYLGTPNDNGLDTEGDCTEPTKNNNISLETDRAQMARNIDDADSADREMFTEG